MGLWSKVKGVFKRKKEPEVVEGQVVVEEGEVNFPYVGEESEAHSEQVSKEFEQATERVGFDRATEPDLADANRETQEAVKKTEARQAEREAKEEEKQKRKVAELKAKADIREQEARIASARGKASVLREKGYETSAKRFMGVVKGVATLGGAVRISKARKGYYVPKMEKGMYVPTSMRSLTTPKVSPSIHSFGSFGRMRQVASHKPSAVMPASPIAKRATSTPTHLAKPMKFVSIRTGESSMAMERLRGLTFPVGLTQTEKMAYAEIKANNDIDTKAHVVSELMELGVPKLEAHRAVEGLLHRKIVVRSKPFDGEPTLEIAR